MLNHLELPSPVTGLVCRKIWICGACAQNAGLIIMTRDEVCPECGAHKPVEKLSVTVAFRWLDKLRNLLTPAELDELVTEFVSCNEQLGTPRWEALVALLSNPGAFERFMPHLAPLMPAEAQVLLQGVVEYMMYGYSTEYVAVRTAIPQIRKAMSQYAPEGRLEWLAGQLRSLGDALAMEASIPLASIGVEDDNA